MAKLEDLSTRLKPSSASSLLLWAMLAFVVIFFIWAAFATIERTVRGQGRVIPSSQLQVVSTSEGGVIEEILVQSGDLVAQDAPLIRLDPTLSGGELGSGEASYYALLVKIARLEAEVANREPRFPAAASPEVAAQIAAERALYAARRADFASLSATGQARIEQAERAVGEARALLAARRQAREARVREAAVVRPLVQSGVEPRLALIQAESAASIAASEVAGAAAALARAQAAVTEARSTSMQVREDWRSTAATELVTAQAELTARRPTLPALQERVERTVLRAPLPGRINRVLTSTVGSAVQPGAALVEIVPSQDSLLIEARIRPEDISFVRMGQEAKVAVTAYDRALHGTLDGRVVTISPDAVTDERTGETYYTVRVRTDSSKLRSSTGAELPIGAGMVAEVDLLGDDRTVLEYIFSPITRLRDEAFRER